MDDGDGGAQSDCGSKVVARNDDEFCKECRGWVLGGERDQDQVLGRVSGRMTDVVCFRGR